MTHTPGPWGWKTVNYDDGLEFGPLSARLNIVKPIGIIYGKDPESFKENDANARLIAAAPELLEALNALTNTARTFRNVPKDEQEWTPIDDEALATALAAITKAEGRG